MNGVTEFIKAMGAARIAAMGAVAAGLIGFFAFLMLRFSEPQLAILYTDLPFEESTKIVEKLESLNVPHEVRQNGAVILAPEERVLRLRMQLAEDGLPAGGTVGYEIFDKGDTLGATSFVQNINRVRAIEGELARTIRALDRVQMARVHLVLPKRKLFAENAAEPSASIVVKVRGSLDASRIKAIQHLVASAVEGLKPQRVSIVDESGTLLASGSGEADDVSATAVDERNRAFERRMQHEIEEIVSSVVGAGRARVRVNAEIDYNRITQTSDTYDPDGQVVRSSQSREETNESTTPTQNDGVTVGNELPAANAEQANQGTERENASKTEEIVNYEISKTTKTEIIEAGRIKRLSVAVLVDGNYATSADGKVGYTPRTAEEIEQIKVLVQSAIGFDKDRGDNVHVANLRFAASAFAAADTAGEEGFLGFSLSKTDYFKLAELAVILVVSLLVLLFVVRPLVRRIVTPEEPELPAELALQTDPATGALIAPDGTAIPAGSDLAALSGPQARGEAMEMLEQARAQGSLQATAIQEVGEIVANNPEEATTIIRGWIAEDE